MKEAAGSASPAADEDRGRQLSPCADTDGTALDEVNAGCSEYHTNTDWCGDWDDADFFSMTMCCACGGVQRRRRRPWQCFPKRRHTLHSRQALLR